MSTNGNLRAARLESINDGVVRLGPETVHIDITNSCNTDCITCWDHSPHLESARPAAWKRQRVDALSTRALIDDIEALGGLKAVIVSGMGEPFTHPEVYEILADLKARKLHVTVITNLLAADVSRIVELGVDSLLIGIHAASEASYLAFHPSWSAMHWQRLSHSLQVLREAGRHDKHVQVICQVNAHELVAMVQQAARYHAAQLNFKLASLRQGTQVVGITEAQRAQLLDYDLPRARETADKLLVQTNLDVFEQQLRAGGRHTAPIREIGCFMGYYYSRITVEGTVLYCCSTEVEVGSLASGMRFSDLWRGPGWQDLRDRLRAGQYCDSCYQCGKLNQNVKLGQRFRERFGDARLHHVTGRDADGAALLAPAVRKRSLTVLP